MSHAHEDARPVGGTLVTGPFLVMLGLAAFAVVIVLWRVFFGLGSVSAMNDAYAWGIWKPLNVVTFTGVGAGAFGMAIIVYVLNRGHYHGMVRSAIVTGAFAYSLAGASVLVDLGRWWNIWRFAMPNIYNLNSILLEVALCVMAYTGVLWMELTVPILERARASRNTALRLFASRNLPRVERALPFIVALAILLPTMHQSSLGSLMMVSESKVHPLWHTAWLPFLFLVSCLMMGYAAVVMENVFSSATFGRAIDRRMLASISKVYVGLTGVYLVVRFADLAVEGKLGLVFSSGWFSVLLLAEVLLFAAPAVVLARASSRQNVGVLLGCALSVVAGGALYRFDAYLVAFNPGPNYHYFPSVLETMMSVGWVSIGVAGYTLLVKMLPILSGIRRPTAEPLPAGVKNAAAR
jgi:Ni/Fe-hydrogenase subunit HybB-like protein